MPTADRPLHICVLTTPNANMLATVAFLDVFRAANYLQRAPVAHWTLLSEPGGIIVASNGLQFASEQLPNALAHAPDILVVSSSWTPENYATHTFMASLQRMARGARLILGLDTGAVLMARAGLLAGRRATVHYEHIDSFAETFPDIDVSEDLVVFDGPFATCPGGLAAADLGLHILRDVAGAGLTNAVSKYMFHPQLRPRGARQVDQGCDPLGRMVPSNLRAATDLMEQHLEHPLSIPGICAGIGLSHRQLDRLFREHVGQTPLAYYRDIRLDRARGLVTQTELPMSEIALASGFATQVHFSRAYKARFGQPPSHDRRDARVPFEFRAWPMFHPPR